MAGRRGRDADVRGIIDNLLGHSDEFARLWERQDIVVPRNDRKRIVHPQIGVLDLNCRALFSQDGRQRLLWFTPPPGTDTAEQLELLSVMIPS